MASLANYLKSSIGRKYLMGLTGLGLAAFVFVHMAGNLLIFVGAEAYNLYGHKITSNPLNYYPAEIGLLVMVLVHVYCAITLSLENKAAKNGRYAVSASGDKATPLASRTMMYSGSVILAFLIWHLLTFKYGPFYTATYDGLEVRDLHRLMVEVLYSPVYVIGYIVSLLLLGLHLRHGVSSAFQSLGMNHPRYTPTIRTVGWIYAIVVAAGFIAQPLYIFLSRS